MSIKKRHDGKWLLNIKPGGRSGKQIKRIFNTQKEAKNYEIWLRSKVQDDAEWQPTKKDTRRLSDLVDAWWDHHGRNLRSGNDTHSRLKNMCTELENPVAANFKADDFTEYRKNRIKNGIKPNTLNREHAYLRSVFNELARMNLWDKENPLSKVRQFKIQEDELTYLEKSQIELLLGTLKFSENADVYLITKVCLSTGSRWSEAEELKVSQVKNSRIEYAGKTKSLKARTVPISKELEKELIAHHKKNLSDVRLFGNGYDAFRWAIEKIGISLPEGQLTHVLRHTFASHFMMQGGDIMVLQRILGHQSLVVTMRYAHFAPEHLEQAVKFNPLSDN